MKPEDVGCMGSGLNVSKVVVVELVDGRWRMGRCSQWFLRMRRREQDSAYYVLG